MPRRQTRPLEQLDTRCLLSAGALPLADPYPFYYQPSGWVIHVYPITGLLGTVVVDDSFISPPQGSMISFATLGWTNLLTNSNPAPSASSPLTNAPARPSAGSTDKTTASPGEWNKPEPVVAEAPIATLRTPTPVTASPSGPQSLPSPQGSQATEVPAPLVRPSTPIDSPAIPPVRRPAAEDQERHTGQASHRHPVASWFWTADGLPSPAWSRDASFDDSEELYPELPTVHAGTQAQFEAGETSPGLPITTDQFDQSDDWSLSIRWAVALSAWGITMRRFHGRRTTRPDSISLPGEDTNDV
jgi:hypothetical protein